MNRVLIAVVTGVVIGRAVHAQRSQNQTTGSSEVSRLLASPNWVTRARGFDLAQERPGTFATPAMARQLLQLLAREERLVLSTLRESGGRIAAGDRYGEEYSEYYSAVLDACFHYCDREAFLNLMLQSAKPGAEGRSSTIEMLGGIVDSGFTRAQQGRMIDVFISAADDSSSFMVRSAGLSSVDAAIRAGIPLSSQQRERLHRAAIHGVQDQMVEVRLWAIEALAAVADSADRELLLRIAATDTSTMRRRGLVTYPTREKAREAAEQILRRSTASRP